MRATHPMRSGFLIVLLLLATSMVCYGLDTDLYVVSGVNIPPNVLIILDNSASMDEVSSGQIYDPTIDYI
jgi:hypothetical protein